MPRAAIVKGYANRIVPLEAIGSHLVANLGLDRSSERDVLASEKIDRSAEKNDRDDKSDKNEKNERIPASSNRS